jgi:hypothetical protein
MPKERLTRLGLPERSAKVLISVTPTEKAAIQAAARERGETVTAYLLGLHRRAKKGGQK